MMGYVAETARLNGWAMNEKATRQLIEQNIQVKTQEGDWLTLSPDDPRVGGFTGWDVATPGADHTVVFLGQGDPVTIRHATVDEQSAGM